MDGTVIEDNRKWSKASLRILGKNLQPDEIGAALGLKASRAHLRGERQSPRQKGVWRESLWSLDSPLGDESDIADHLKWLLDLLEPKLDIMRMLSEKYRIDLFCGFSSGSGQGGFALGANMLVRLARFGIPLVLDLYPPTNEIN